MFSEDKIPANIWLSKCSPALPMAKHWSTTVLPTSASLHGANMQKHGPWATLEALRCRSIWGAQACSMGSCWAGLKTTKGSAAIGCQVLLFDLPDIHILTGRCTPLHTSSYPLCFPWCYSILSCSKLVIDLSKPSHCSSPFLTWDILQAGTG